MSPEILGLTILFGSLGALLRYLIGTVWRGGAHRYGAIVAVNIAGSALAGAVVALPESALGVAVIAGLCGGLTTFSTLAVHLLPVPDARPLASRVRLGVLHGLGSVGSCIVAFEVVSLLTG